MARTATRLIVLIALALAGCAEAPRFDQVVAQLPPQGATARLFVYRDYDLTQSLSWVPIKANGNQLGGLGPGHVLVCDLPPGTYTIEAQSQGLWPEQNKTVTVAAGQQVYARIGSFHTTDPDSHGQVLMTTFVVMLQDSAAGRRDIAQLWYTPCEHPLVG